MNKLILDDAGSQIVIGDKVQISYEFDRNNPSQSPCVIDNINNGVAYCNGWPVVNSNTSWRPGNQKVYKI